MVSDGLDVLFNRVDPLKLYNLIVDFEERLNKIQDDCLFDGKSPNMKQQINQIRNDYADLHTNEIYGDKDLSHQHQFNMFPKYDKDNDFYANMTAEAVKELWNNDKYTREGLKNIALSLLQWVNER
jgi:hypothetical protein